MDKIFRFAHVYIKAEGAVLIEEGMGGRLNNDIFKRIPGFRFLLCFGGESVLCIFRFPVAVWQAERIDDFAI